MLNLLGLIPSNNVGDANLIQAGEESEGGKDERCDDELIVVKELDEGIRLLLR